MAQPTDETPSTGTSAGPAAPKTEQPSGQPSPAGSPATRRYSREELLKLPLEELEKVAAESKRRADEAEAKAKASEEAFFKSFPDHPRSLRDWEE